MWLSAPTNAFVGADPDAHSIGPTVGDEMKALA
jgi:hypothetical protein